MHHRCSRRCCGSVALGVCAGRCAMSARSAASNRCGADDGGSGDGATRSGRVRRRQVPKLPGCCGRGQRIITLWYGSVLCLCATPSALLVSGSVRMTGDGGGMLPSREEPALSVSRARGGDRGWCRRRRSCPSLSLAGHVVVQEGSPPGGLFWILWDADKASVDLCQD
jgi:hypothetical protein